MINKNSLEKIKSKRIYLRLLNIDDASNEYLHWLCDSEVNQFLESRFNKYSLAKIKDFINNMRNSKNDFLFGIFLRNTDDHIGNIKIGNINKVHQYAELGILIGRKDQWGKGFGAEAIQLATKFAFRRLRLKKLIAGIYSNNIGSYKAFLKSGYTKAGLLRKHRRFNNRYVDEIIVEKINK